MKAIQLTTIAAVAISLASCDNKQEEEVIVPADTTTSPAVVETTEIIVDPAPLETETNRPPATERREISSPATPTTPQSSDVIEVPAAEITEPGAETQ